MKNKPVILVGAGGHARVLAEALRLLGKKIFGAVAAGAPVFSGIRFLGSDEALMKKYKPEEVMLVNGIGGTGVASLRKEVYERFKKKNYRFLTVVHPSAVIARDVVLLEGAQVMAGAVVQAGSQIGVNTILNTRCSIDHDARIGNHVHVAPGAVLCGGVTVGNECHIGAGAVLIQGTHIAQKFLIKAGQVVKGNVR